MASGDLTDRCALWTHNVLSQLPERCSDHQRDSPDDPRPFELSASAHSSFVEVSKDRLSAAYSGAGQQQQGSHDVGSVQTSLPVPRQAYIYYFEMTVQDKGERGRVTIGFTVKDAKMTSQPGWELNTYGYHGDDGRKYCFLGNNSRHSNTGTDYGPHFGTGDTVGAGIHLESQEIFFTHNGQMLGTAFKQIPSLTLYPTVGMHSRSEKISVNLGAKPFLFDIDSHLEQERQKQQDAIERGQVSPGATHQIVQDYLRHYGYGDTLQAFDRAAGLSDSTPSTSGRSDMEDSLLATRQQVRQAIMHGRVQEAQKLLHGSHPDLLESVLHPNLDVLIFFHCLQYIELIREGKISEAVRFAQETLSPLRGIMAHRSKEYDALLHDTVALIAYEQPQESPVSGLLSDAQREAVADVVNAALLASASGRPRWEVKPQAHLDQILRQLVAVHAEKVQCNSGQGEVFKLQHHLSLQQSAHNGVENMSM